MLALLLEKEVEFSLFNSDSEFQILYAIEIIYIITTAIELLRIVERKYIDLKDLK